MKPTVELVDYDTYSLLEAVKNYRGANEQRAEKLLNELWTYGHYSVYEFASFTFKIENMSAVALRHITRHRTFKFACSSNRHKRMRIDKTAHDILHFHFLDLLPDDLQGKINYCQVQMVLKDNEQLTNDELTYFTPASYRYNLVVKADLRNLVNFWVQRLHPSAHFEIRQIAIEMFKLVEERVPFIDLRSWIGSEWNKIALTMADKDYTYEFNRYVKIKEE